ncbi:Aldehyde dehydrogenase family, putative [Angomonas deanei]|uniref:Aldehyde dehydrogenase family, putative n=1 Tax=Angomonas deanei TaxID=59799 RepID=A0A7G2CJ49_9TRYP|nr:Aldehyde dehydrogenase family, putative [Angomonas deanei]
MVMMPLIGAIAAGNTVVVKLSEFAPETARLFMEMLPKYVPEGIVGFVYGAVEEATALLKERFDHIFFTGGAPVGKVVMTAAAQHLTPVTLEIGGKSPTVVDERCDGEMDTVASRIAWGKFVNCGQTCVAPDYVLVHTSVKKRFVEALEKARRSFFGVDGDVLASPNYGRIVNQQHWDRLNGLLDKGETVLLGGERNRETLQFATTVVENADINGKLMTDEIFGPILPLVTYERLEEAIQFIKQREKPLALYVFTKHDAVRKRFCTETSSGGLVFNDVMLHVGITGLPFGGVGYSGLGNYHGAYSFDTFSHTKTVLNEGTGLECFMKVRYPPYSEEKTKWFRFAMEKSRCCCM